MNLPLFWLCKVEKLYSGSCCNLLRGSPSSRKSSILNSSSLISPRCEAGPLCSFWRSSIYLIYWYLIDSGFRVILRSFLNLGIGLSRSKTFTEDLRDLEARLLRALWIMSKIGSSVLTSPSRSINKIINPPVRQIMLLKRWLLKDELINCVRVSLVNLLRCF